MLQYEFEERTGLTTTAEEFVEIVHKVYMACATLDKDEFCSDYKKHGMGRIIPQLMDCIAAKDNSINELFTQLTTLENKANTQNIEMAEFLLGKAAAYEDEDFEYKALELVSRSTAITIKVKNGFPLTASDIEYIAKNLK